MKTTLKPLSKVDTQQTINIQWRPLLHQLFQVREMTLLFLVLGCGIVFGLTVPNFASLGNALSIADTLVFDLMITTGMTMALVSGVV